MGDFRRTGAPEAQKLGGRSNNAAINSAKNPQFCDSKGLQIRYRILIQNILQGSRFAGSLLQIHHPGLALLRPRDRRNRIISLCAFTYLPGRINRNSPQNTWAHKCVSVFVNPRVLDSQNRVFWFAWIRLCWFVWIRYRFAARIHGYAELWKNPFQNDKFSSEITNFCDIKKRQNRRFTFDIYSDFCLKQASNVFCSIFVFAYVRLYILFKIRTLDFQSVMF